MQSDTERLSQETCSCCFVLLFLCLHCHFIEQTLSYSIRSSDKKQSACEEFKLNLKYVELKVMSLLPVSLPSPEVFITSSFTCNIKIVLLVRAQTIKNPEMQWISKIEVYFSFMLTIQGRQANFAPQILLGASQPVSFYSCAVQCSRHM